MSFFIKKLLSRLLFPVPLCAGFLLFGLILWAFSRWKKTGRGMILAGTLLLLVFGYPWLPYYVLVRIESQYPPLLEEVIRKTENGNIDADGRSPSGVFLSQLTNGVTSRDGTNINSNILSSEISAFHDPSPAFIMVLSSGALSADTNRPVNARFSDVFLKRFTEGVRLWRNWPNAKLLVSVSGYAVSDSDKAYVLTRLLAIYGLSIENVSLLSSARDTEDEIAWCKGVVSTNPVILVSCASHLPRVMILARRHSLNAIPAPSGYLVDAITPITFSPNHLFPGSINVFNCERAMNEYLGLAWEAIRY